MAHDTLDPLLSEKALAIWLGISLPTLQRKRSDGTGPRFVQLSARRVAYRRGDVERWLGSRTIDRVGALASAGQAPELPVADRGRQDQRQNTGKISSPEIQADTA
jgi:predicted DNA-binding transcriptional regulator AlpA